MVMLFSVPFLQKLASPSYDVFAYVAITAFAINMLNLAKITSFKTLTRKQILYTLLTIILILLSKNNYVFILLTLFILPMFTTPIFNFYNRSKKQSKIFFWIILAILTFFFIQFLNEKFGLINFTKIFINNYLNVVTMGRRGGNIFSVVSTILPEIFNIFWILSAFFVMLSEERYNWKISFVLGEIMIFFINWIGIFAGFYLVFDKPNKAFDDLSGRYLHPYIICFLPFTQFLSYRYNLKISKKAVQTIAVSSTLFIMVSYLIVCYYRGFIVHTTPTWVS
ncbi:hypothetical protein [Candidatus Enterococcus ikei]|uniref:Uncharacterized protein n=1 Tax=Candidatus Enterococcus ikei TaxID=2815326 RepID=A0ABS3H132_9ENTE|nr:hypothetical protein [Enterococcus sp. DIV0869a]MBO0440394.1 hypothetical protein [Enterococcus sp. DIV0869a]